MHTPPHLRTHNAASLSSFPFLTWSCVNLQIKENFCELIGSTIETSIRSVRAYVKLYLVRTLIESRLPLTSQLQLQHALRSFSCLPASAHRRQVAKRWHRSYAWL